MHEKRRKRCDNKLPATNSVHGETEQKQKCVFQNHGSKEISDELRLEQSVYKCQRRRKLGGECSTKNSARRSQTNLARTTMGMLQDEIAEDTCEELQMEQNACKFHTKKIVTKPLRNMQQSVKSKLATNYGGNTVITTCCNEKVY